ncbi:MAG TPA: sigma-70 family RNA polymerase sigma factor [Candidatus Dormibacteraeota bacterium]|nr:sigma-70 family RNA polymerase sigma factor [Candidatus Dormibacteraeota bacterium]
MPERPEFEDLYREFLPRIYGFCLAQLRNAAEAEDVTAQVFTKAYQAYGRFEPQAATPAAWLFRIARNALLDFHRRSGVRERTLEAAGRELGEDRDPARLAEERVLFGDLLEAVRRLPDRQREVIALRHRSDLGFLEIGRLMDCSEDAAKMLYHRALKALRTELREDG